MQLQTIPPFSISIGTGDQANLAYGLPLFPALGSARAGISSTSRSNTILDFEFTILFSRTKFHSYYLFLMGVLGPAIAFDLPGNVTLTNLDKNQGQVAVTFGNNQQIVAGQLIGLAGGAGFSLTQQFYLPVSWYSPWRFSWQTAFDRSFSFVIDILTLLLALIRLLIKAGVSKGIISPNTASKLNNFLGIGGIVAQAFAFYDVNYVGFGPARTVTATPSLTVPIDLVSYVLSLANFVRQLSSVVAEMQFGPQFTVLMPVTLQLDEFQLTGAQRNGSSATYRGITYRGSTATATGPVFTDDPARFTTKVSYTTEFTIALAFFFKIKLCKLFNKQWTSPSLDLLQLLNLPRPGTDRISGTVTTDVQGGCVLIPVMSMTFISQESDPVYGAADLNSAISGIPVQAKILLGSAWQGLPTTISLEISPPANFPSSVALTKGSTFAFVSYTFPNESIISGKEGAPTSRIPATAYSPYQSYLITARVNGTDPSQPCADWEVTVPLKVQNRYIIVKLDATTSSPGPVPPYAVDNPELLAAGGQINADPDRPDTDVKNFAKVFYWFPFPPGNAPPAANVDVEVSVLNEGRKPVGANLKITFDSGASAVLTHPVTLNIAMGTPAAQRSFTLQWTKTSIDTPNFSTLFILVINGGAAYGQAEFWVNVWNWA